MAVAPGRPVSSSRPGRASRRRRWRPRRRRRSRRRRHRQLVGAAPAVGLASARRPRARAARDGAHGDRGVLADALGERDRLVDDLVRGHDAVHEPERAARAARRSGRRSSRARARSRAARAWGGGSARPRRPSARASPRGCRTARCSAATTRSHDSTISKPPASAGPFTAAMIGFGKSRFTMPREAALAARDVGCARPCATTLRSAPAENTSPVPVSTTARTSVSASISSKAGHRGGPRG